MGCSKKWQFDNGYFILHKIKMNGIFLLPQYQMYIGYKKETNERNRTMQAEQVALERCHGRNKRQVEINYSISIRI